MHLKRWVLSLARNCSRLMVKERRWSGKEFQILGAATRKLHLPSSDLVVGTYKSPQCAERRPTLPLTSVSGVQYKLSMLHSSGKRFGFTDYQHANFIGKKCQKCERYCGKPHHLAEVILRSNLLRISLLDCTQTAQTSTKASILN